MAERIEVEKTAIISSPSHSVRAMLGDGEMMFSARDILAACGIKYPDKWMKRNEERYSIEKMEYPLMTGCGIRRIRMLFVRRDCASRMIAATACPSETRRWLLKEVLVYTIGEAVHDDEPATKKPSTGRMEELGKLVDKALIELLEVKKYIARVGAAG